MLDRLLEFGRDLGWIASAFKTNRRTDPDRDLVRARHSPSCLLQFEQSINTHRDDGNTQVVYQQADTRPESLKLAVGGVVPLREDQDAKAVINGLSSKSEALAKAGFARKRKKVK